MAKLIGVFAAILLAEMADKTQLATIAFATDRELSPWAVFLAASAALVVASAGAVLVGSFTAKYLGNFPFSLVSGLLFIAIGIFSVLEHFGINVRELLMRLYS